MRAVRCLAGLLVALASTASPAVAEDSAQDMKEIAREAYLYAYPIVTMDASMRQSTNVPDAVSIPLRAPVNQFAHARTYPRAEDRDVVRYNFDTLYSMAWLDLAREPIVLSVPDTGGRYYMLPMLDMWTDVFAVVGTRTTGNGAGDFAIVSPTWAGKLPDHVQKIIAPTSIVWILGRTQTDGPADYDSVHKVQDGYRLTPLSQWGRPYTPPNGLSVDPSVDTKTPPFFQVNKSTGVAVLTRLASLLDQNPPHGNDYPILFRMRRLGFEVGRPFDPSKDPGLAASINEAAQVSLKDIERAGKSGDGLIKVNGWQYALQTVGTYGTSYKQRAFATFIGLGVNLPEDAIYPASFVDGEGKPYDGASRYVIHFNRGELPPAEAFWSIALYDKDGYQVANSINRFAIGDHFSDRKLSFNSDGSLDIYIQAESPGSAKESNWLPAPAGEFNLALRIYSPKPEMREGRWAPPPVERVP
jgi:hypothetical protein